MESDMTETIAIRFFGGPRDGAMELVPIFPDEWPLPDRAEVDGQTYIKKTESLIGPPGTTDGVAGEMRQHMMRGVEYEAEGMRL